MCTCTCCCFSIILTQFYELQTLFTSVDLILDFSRKSIPVLPKRRKSSPLHIFFTVRWKYYLKLFVHSNYLKYSFNKLLHDIWLLKRDIILPILVNWFYQTLWKIWSNILSFQRLIYLFIWKAQVQGERKRQKEIFYTLVHFPNGCDSQGWVTPKLRVSSRSPTWKEGPRDLSHHLLHSWTH